jgi:hypothetical protein
LLLKEFGEINHLNNRPEQDTSREKWQAACSLIHATDHPSCMKGLRQDKENGRCLTGSGQPTPAIREARDYKA